MITNDFAIAMGGGGWWVGGACRPTRGTIGDAYVVLLAGKNWSTHHFHVALEREAGCYGTCHVYVMSPAKLMPRVINKMDHYLILSTKGLLALLHQLFTYSLSTVKAEEQSEQKR